MSRNGTFEGFFPSAPLVQQQKRKRAALDRERLESSSEGVAHDAQSPSTADLSSNQYIVKRPRLSSHGAYEERNHANGEPGDLLNGVGSASSLNSTASSVKSHNGQPPPSSRTGGSSGSYAQTPLTVPESSSPDKGSAVHTYKVQIAPAFENSDEPEPLTSQAQLRRHASLPPEQSQPMLERPGARPIIGQVKGEKAVYDPDLDRKLSSKERRNPNLKVRYIRFGEKVCVSQTPYQLSTDQSLLLTQSQETIPPPDPRLAIPGYRAGDLNVNLKASAKIWKAKARHAPYILPQYQWVDGISIGSGPPTAVVVTGFDPFTPDTQLRAFFGGYGEIAAIDNKTDPNTGSFLGICWIRYRDATSSRSSSSSSSSTAVDAARKAEKEGTGQRVGLQSVKVERDRIGRRARRYVEKVSKRNQERRARESQAEEARRQTKHTLRIEPTMDAGDTLPTPPPNAPKGPARRPPPQPRASEIPRGGLMLRSSAQSRIEAEPVLAKIRKNPYIFISHSSVPVMATTPPHLERRMKMFYWTEIRCDETGYYIIFEDSLRGKNETRRCCEAMNGQAMFTYTMDMECQADGNPNFIRSPSPETAAAEKKKREEEERIASEEAADWEEELKQRAENLDPARGALEQLKIELKDKIMSDIKQRIAVPALNDFLDPAHHAVRRQKLGIPDPSQRLAQGPSYVSQLGSAGPLKKRLGYGHITLSHKTHRESTNVFADERRRKPQKKKPEVMTLHHRLQTLYAEDESDDEEKRTSREETKMTGSTPISRLGSEMPGDDSAPRRRAHLEVEDSVRGEESGDEDFGIAKSVLDPHLLKKEPEDMALRELQMVISTLPPSSRLHKHAKKELGVRKRNLEDERLFHIKMEEEIEPSIEDVGMVTDMHEEVPVQTIEEVVPKKKKPRKRRPPKPMLEERGVEKAFEKSDATIIGEDIAVSGSPKPGDKEIDMDIIEGEEEEEHPEVEWGLSTDVPRRTVEDEPGLIMDIDGWQHLSKDDEDFRFMKTAMLKVEAAKFHNITAWVTGQKTIKFLNNGGIEGISFEPTNIKGYYVPNRTGSARTEGVGKILESEKSKYLPHRIRVREAREKRQAEKANPAVQAEEARRAKQAATANSRTSRANNRTAVKDLNVVKQNLIAEGQQGDAIRFNMLKKRKKLVRFERSAIHGWGLYADENIAVNDMIIEYVGEKVRQAVANIREDKYDKQGVGSSYLFRIDDDTIVDATKKGGIARFINHSCAPNCTAKIIKVEGSKRIVIYALREIAKSKSPAISHHRMCANKKSRRRVDV